MIYGIIGEEIYYRILWLLPVTIVIAYTIIKIYAQLDGKKHMAFGCGSISDYGFRWLHLF